MVFSIRQTDLNKSALRKDGALNWLDCQALDIMKLQNKKLKENFFKQLDSILHVQHPNNDKEAEIFIDIDRKLLTQFLKDIDRSAG